FCLRCKLAIVHSKGTRRPLVSETASSDRSDTESQEPDPRDAPVALSNGPFHDGIASYSPPTRQSSSTLERTLLLTFITLSSGALLSAYGISMAHLWKAIATALNAAANAEN
ncbi:MAG: hypothetical protein JO145_02630, partial [Acidobacteriaceae bacterium]|nr:hypothetical protein [Acidobacteriaceae bacterium]